MPFTPHTHHPFQEVSEDVKLAPSLRNSTITDVLAPRKELVLIQEHTPKGGIQWRMEEGQERRAITQHEDIFLSFLLLPSMPHGEQKSQKPTKE